MRRSLRAAYQPHSAYLAIDEQDTLNISRKQLTFRNSYLCDSGCFQPLIPIPLPVHIDFDELDRLANLVAKGIILAYAVAHERVVVELLDIVWGIAGYSRSMPIMRESGWIYPCLFSWGR